jgi:hypothetical protein
VLGLLCLTCVLGGGAAAGDAGDAGEAGWVERARDAGTGTVVWVRDRGPAAPQFRAVARMRTSLSALAAVLLEPAEMPRWVYRTRLAQALPGSRATEGVAFVVTSLPGLLSDRESVVAWRLWQEPSGRVTMQGQAATVPEAPAPDPSRVRMSDFASRWMLQPLGDGMVEVTFEGHADLGGNLDLPLLRDFVRQAVWRAPLHTIEGLRRMVDEPRFRDARLGFIREPGA